MPNAKPDIRITIRVSEETRHQLKVIAANERTTITEIVTKLIAERIKSS